MKPEVLDAKRQQLQAIYRRDSARVSDARGRLEIERARTERTTARLWAQMRQLSGGNRMDSGKAGDTSLRTDQILQTVRELQGVRRGLATAQDLLRNSTADAAKSHHLCRLVEKAAEKLKQVSKFRADSRVFDEVSAIAGVAKKRPLCTEVGVESGSGVRSVATSSMSHLSQQPAPTQGPAPLPQGTNHDVPKLEVVQSAQHVSGTESTGESKLPSLSLSCASMAVGTFGLKLSGGSGMPVQVVVECGSNQSVNVMVKELGQMTAKLKSLGIDIGVVRVQVGASLEPDAASTYLKRKRNGEEVEDERVGA